MKEEKKEQKGGLLTALISLGLIGYIVYLAIKALIF